MNSMSLKDDLKSRKNDFSFYLKILSPTIKHAKKKEMLCKSVSKK